MLPAACALSCFVFVFPSKFEQNKSRLWLRPPKLAFKTLFSSPSSCVLCTNFLGASSLISPRNLYLSLYLGLTEFNNPTMFKRRKQQQPQQQKPKVSTYDLEEVTSIKWEMISMTDQEEDLIYRMYRLVGDRWALIAGRIPGRKPEEIERYWIMKHGEGFAQKREACRDLWRRC